MPKYIVSYDLHKHRDYTRVIASLKANNAARILESLWLIDVPNTAPSLRDEIAADLDNDDSVLVIELVPGVDWATLRCQTRGVDWLERNITPAAE